MSEMKDKIVRYLKESNFPENVENSLPDWRTADQKDGWGTSVHNDIPILKEPDGQK